MKKVLTFLFLIFHTFSFSQNTYVPDNAFENYLIKYGYDSGPLDNYVPTNNIKNIETLFLDNLGIENFEGLQDFIALKNLKVIAGSNVKQIDISKNVNLIEFQIFGSPLLQNFDTSLNTKLEIFTIVNNSITKVDLSKNTEIKDITIGNTIIKNIDLSKNIKLENIDLNYGSIENINLNNNHNTSIKSFSSIGQLELKCVRVDNEIYSKTNWISITNSDVYSETCVNFQELTYVPDDNFEQELINFGYDSGPLDDYVLTKNIENVLELHIQEKNISNLTGIQDFKSLTSLTCYKNSLTSINLNTLTELSKLVISENKLTNLNISNNTKLTYLIASENELTNLNISNNINLEQLSCSKNKITNLDVSLNVNLSVLWCTHNKLNQLNLASNKNLKRLSSGGNLFTSIDVSNNNLLEEFYSPDGNLESLNLTNNPKINYFVVSNNKLTFLDLRNGANYNIPGHSFDTRKNNLKCIFVDDKIFSQNNWNFIDTISTFNNTEAECNQTTCNISVDNLDDVNVCDSFTLPNLTNGKYYTKTNGNGNQLNPGDIITSIQTIFIYNVDTNNTNCSNESSFNVTITNKPPVDSLNDVNICNSFILPNLTNGKYYTKTNGNGNQLNSGDVITSTQTIFIYNLNNTNCSNESSFNITITNKPPVDSLNNILAINNYILPNIVNGKYYTETNGNGNKLNPGDIITTSQTVYIYNANPLNLNCFNISSFNVTIEEKEIIIPFFFTPNNDNINDTWIVNANKNLIKEIYITDRFGKVVSKIKPNTIGWNGLYNGKQLPTNTYWYQIIFTSGEVKNGSLALIRN